jgi:hypothetical protein
MKPSNRVNLLGSAHVNFSHQPRSLLQAFGRSYDTFVTAHNVHGNFTLRQPEKRQDMASNAIMTIANCGVQLNSFCM